MVHAVKVIRDHPSSPSAAELLIHLAAEFGVAIPDRQNYDGDATPVDADDEAIVDAAELKRRVTNH